MVSVWSLKSSLTCMNKWEGRKQISDLQVTYGRRNEMIVLNEKQSLSLFCSFTCLLANSFTPNDSLTYLFLTILPEKWEERHEGENWMKACPAGYWPVSRNLWPQYLRLPSRTLPDSFAHTARQECCLLFWEGSVQQVVVVVDLLTLPAGRSLPGYEKWKRWRNR